MRPTDDDTPYPLLKWLQDAKIEQPAEFLVQELAKVGLLRSVGSIRNILGRRRHPHWKVAVAFSAVTESALSAEEPAGFPLTSVAQSALDGERRASAA